MSIGQASGRVEGANASTRVRAVKHISVRQSSQLRTSGNR